MSQPDRRARLAVALPWTLAGAAAVMLLALSLTLAGPARADSASPDPSDFMRWGQAASDPATAAEMVPRLRSIIATTTDSIYVGILRQMLLRALISSHAPAKQIAAAADTASKFIDKVPRARSTFYVSVAQTLADRGEEMPKAVEYARKAIRTAPPLDQENAATRSYILATSGYVFFKAASYDTAIRYLTMALPYSSDSADVLFYLGAAHEKKGRTPEAMGFYFRSLGVFPGHDTLAAAPLRALYAKKNGSLAGLDTKITTALNTSREQVALAPRRYEKPAPEWSLASLDGQTVESSSFKGKVVVMDFWGSWCGPCRMELPIFDAMYQRYKDHPNVRFVGVNWERAGSAEIHAKTARDYMTQNNLTFPVVIDPEQRAVGAYGIQGFPTVYVIDKTGTIRYRNVGVAQDIEDILEAQLQSLLQ